MHDISIAAFLAELLVILLSAKLFGEVAERFGQPAVLGELVGGVILGCGFLSFFHPTDPVLSLLAELGIILLLFETGLDSDLNQLMKVGPVSLAVACLGVVVPLILGYGCMRFLGHGGMEAVFVGAALTATSVGITARVLADLGKLDRLEAQIILGAAVIDDIIGVIILTVVEGLAQTGQATWGAMAAMAVLSIGFVGVAIGLGPRVSEGLVKVVVQMKSRGVLIVAAVCFAFALALVARAMGTALIIGAFTAGLLLAKTERKVQIHDALRPVTDIFVPIFFVMVGVKVDLRAYNPFMAGNGHIIALALMLIGVAIVSKIFSGWAVRRPGINRIGIGVGMVPRGEIGLIFAQIGLSSGVIEAPLYAALVGMVVMTTFVTPPLLKAVFK